VGTWHKVDAKHLPAYLAEMCFRFNNRNNPYLFRDTIMKLIALQISNTKNRRRKLAPPLNARYLGVVSL
jgi:hypothetical protein